MLATSMPTAPSVNMKFIGARAGTAVARAVTTAAVAGKLSPELLGEAIISSSTVRGHVQAEALRYVAVRVSLLAPSRLAWLTDLITHFLCSHATGGDAIRSLGQRSLVYHVTAFGLRGTAASAVAAAAVQCGFNTCSLVTSNCGFWRARPERMSLAQYRYDTLTCAYGGVGTVLGGGVGAALGSLVAPGFGTALGSIVFSMGGGCLPSYLRDGRGPDVLRRQVREAEQQYTPLDMRDREDGFVELCKASDHADAVVELVEQPPGCAANNREPLDDTWVVFAVKNDVSQENGAKADDTSDSVLHSQLHFSAVKETEAAATSATRQMLSGSLEFFEAAELSAVDAKVDECDEHDIVFVFAVQ